MKLLSKNESKAQSSPSLGDENVVLAMEHVSLIYDTVDRDARAVFEDLNLEVERGELVCVVGPSGCGKTTLLNLVAGIISATSGRVELGGQPPAQSAYSRATVFQHASLFPWRSVTRNITYGLEMQKKFSKAERQRRADELLSLVGLSGYGNSNPWQLSGGMQQRANLARALAVEPDLLLLDEPFSALDAQTRAELQGEFLRIRASRDATALFVTHDVDEAVFLADRVIVLSARPSTVVRDVRIDLPRPRDRYSATFIALVGEIHDELRRVATAQPQDVAAS